MIVVIDTNALLPALSTTHGYHVSFRAWLRGEFSLALSNEILLEYEEIARPRLGELRWQHFLALLERLAMLHENVLPLSPTFRFRLITADPDDDKFADCAIAAQADYVITEDRHFRPLAGAGFKPQPITPQEFIARHLLGGAAPQSSPEL